MKTGDILLFKGEDGMSNVISWGTGSVYSHVAVCVSPEMNLAIEAMAWKGVRARDIRKIPERYDVFRIKEKYVFKAENTMAHLVDKLDSGYDYPGVIFLGVLKVLSKIGIPLKGFANRWQVERDYFCSELCYEAFFKGGGLDIVPDISEADITSPGDIAKSGILEKVS